LNGLYGRHNLPQIEAPEASFVPLHRHLLQRDGPRFWVAEANGPVVGCGASMVRGDWWFLASLFVLPEFQGKGVGRTLIEHARVDVPTGCTRQATITDTVQPISTIL